MADQRPNQLASKVAELRAALQESDPALLAKRTGSEWIPRPVKTSPNPEVSPTQGEFRLSLWDKPVSLTFPSLVACDPLTGTELSLDVQALLLYYFNISDGTPLTGEWISFAELPNGRFYHKAFQGYTGNELVKVFQSNYKDFAHIAISLGGVRQPFGDASFAFRALPRVALLTVFWRGDEDFPASIQILFDANVSHHLTTDVCAILGSMLTRKFIRAWRSQEKNE